MIIFEYRFPQKLQKGTISLNEICKDVCGKDVKCPIRRDTAERFDYCMLYAKFVLVKSDFSQIPVDLLKPALS